MLNDWRYALRALRSAPGFTAMAALTLALGIGASTAMFSVISAVLLEPLPYRAPQRLARLSEGRPGFELNVSYPNYLDWRQRSRAFESMGAFNPFARAIVTGAGRPEAVSSGTIESRLLTLLGVHPIRGRLFTDDEQTPAGPPVVLISQALWMRRFGGSDAIAGSPISIGGEPATIVGVLAAGFRLQQIDLWFPLGRSIGAVQLDRASHPGFQVYARLRDGVTFARAQQEMSSIARDLEWQYPVANHDLGVFVRPLTETVVGPARPMLLLVSGAVACLLLIACANVANILLARGLRCEREIAVRSALGAGRSRLVRLFLTESFVIAALGGAAGVLLAAWSVRAFRMMAAVVLPRAGDIAVDGRVLAFALGLSALTSLVFGLGPAVQFSRANPIDALRQAGAASVPAGGRRLRAALIAVEVALALLLLVGAGLMVRTIDRLSAVDPGYRPDGLLTLNTQALAGALPDAAAHAQFADRAVTAIQSLPGVRSAALAWPLDIVGFKWSPYANFRDRPFPAGREPAVQMASVTPGYFDTMGIALRMGRVFGPQDRAGAPVAAIVNDTVVRRFLPPGNPIGRHLSLTGIPELGDLEIVGVVGDTLRGGPAGRASAEVYCAYGQFPAGGATVVVRAASGDPLQLAGSVSHRIDAVAPGVATYGPRRMADAMADGIGDRRLLSRLLALFALLALGLTGLGIGGVVACHVGHRTQEIGVRMALGAEPAAVVRMMIGGAMLPVAAGAALGALAMPPLASVIRRFLFGIEPGDPLAIGAAAALLLAASLVAAYVPARRATRINPITALRSR